jgi:hypothetical protein
VGGFGIDRHGCTSAGPEEKKALAVLRNTVTSGVQDTVPGFDFIPATAELIDNLVKESPVIPNRQSLNVLEDEEPGLKLGYQPDEMVNESISWVVYGSLPDQAEALTGGAPEYDIDVGILDRRMFADVSTIDVGDAATNHSAVRKVKFVSGAVDGIVLDRSQHFEASLLETEAHPACPRE